MTPDTGMAIVFDLDGTLVDSAADIHAAVNRMLTDAGEVPMSQEKVAGFVGHGIPTLVRRVMADRATPAEQEPEWLAAMLAHYAAHPADLTRPYPGVPEALAALQAGGYRLGLCTNKQRALSEQILEALGLAPFFNAVIGGDSLAVTKPDPAPLRAAFAALGGTPLLYVGDSEVDAETARRAALPFALFTEGYRKTPVEELAPQIAFSDFAQLPGKVAEMAALGTAAQ
ncbi:phosphoglycolate phosphatase [Vannielia sp. SX4]|uniref:phosphoglycolate phosphatase n=1 Tax=Vannielia sp. SX4 TaxID=3463852 RepID=UPI004059D323